MRLAGIFLAVVATGAGVFAWWGLFTAAGQRRYDEMDALYPALAGIAAAVLLIAGTALVALSLRKRSKA